MASDRRDDGRVLSRRDCLRLGLGGVAAWAATPIGVRAVEKPKAGTIFVHAVEWDLAGQKMRGVFAIDPESGAWRQVIEEGSPSARVSPDGRLLAYAQDGEGKRGIWLYDLEAGGDPRRLTDLYGRPHWSGDGQSLVISGTGSHEGTGEPFETWKIGLDGSGREQLPIPETDYVVDWSADGRWFVAHSNDGLKGLGAIGRVIVVHPDGTGRQVLNDNGAEDKVSWRHRIAPRARRVVYFETTIADSGDDCGLWVVGLDGADRRRFLGEREDEAPFEGVWSPDGRRLAVVTFDRAKNPDGKKNDVIRGGRIEIVDAEGKHERFLDLPPNRQMLPLGWR